MPENRIIKVKYSSNGYTKTRAAYQYDYGQVLRLEGFPEGMLPDPFEVHFSVGNGLAKTQIGTDSAVSVFDECLERYGTIAAWLFLHDTASDGETKYTIEIPVRSRSKPVDAPPTPVQQSAITQAIAALGRGVDAAEAAQGAAETAQGKAEEAQGAAETAQGKAEEAQGAAEAAANSVRNAAATAETLAPGSDATVTVRDVSGVKTFEFGIPAGIQGETGNGIQSAVLNNDYTLTITYTDGTSYTTPSIRGATGNGIQGAVLNNDYTLTITYTDGTSYTTPSIRGAKGDTGATPAMSIGTVTTGAAGSSAAATMTGTPEAPVLNLTIPRGDPGNATIDDTAGEGDTTKVWSADKSDKENKSLLSAFNNIQPEQTTFIETIKSENLFNKNGVIYTGKYFNNNTGAMVDDGRYNATYIPFEGEGTYICYYPANSTGAAYVKLPLFNSEKVFIKYVTGTCLTDPTQNIAQPTKFIISSADSENVAFMGYYYGKTDEDIAMFVKGEVYPSEYVPYFETQYMLDEDIILTIPVDDTLTEEGVPADAKATGTAIANVSKSVNGAYTLIETSKFGKTKTNRIGYFDATAHIDNSDTSNPISNAISASVISVAGNSSGAVPTAFVSQSENLMNPKIVCAGAENRSAGYQIDITDESNCIITDDGDGVYTVVIPPSSSFLQMSDELYPGETYNIYYKIESEVSLGITLYLLDDQYVVTRKLGYISGAYNCKWRVKLAEGEKYFAFTATKSAGATMVLKYPEVWVSDIKESTTDAVTDTTFKNEYSYVPYNTTIMQIDADSIQTLFPGFGQANGSTENILYIKEKKALQYGYYSGATWVQDIKEIDLSSVIGDTVMQIIPNGTLSIKHTTATVPSWVVSYDLNTDTPYAGTNWTGYGDSLTAGPDKNGQWGMYRFNVKDLLKLHKYYDCGVPMSQVSGSGTYQPMWTDARIETLDLASDVVTIMGGTNDTAQLHPYGGISGFGDPTIDNHDVTTFIGAYNVIISKIMYKFMLSDGYYQDVDYTGLTRVAVVKPWFRLVLITPPPSFVDADKVEALIKITECVKQVGALWGLPVVDGHDNLGINAANSEYFYEYDETHPNAEAHLRLAYLIVAKAREIA